MPLRARHRVAAVVTALAASALTAACATSPNDSLRFAQPIVLLGEVHDNAAQHAMRLRALEQHLANGKRPALAFEQFDREHQSAIDRLLALPSPSADALIAQFGGKGWQWQHYEPFIALAIEYRLPIVAANVSRNEARNVMRDGLAAHGFDAAVPDDVMAAHAAAIEAGHCGLIDNATARRMALAQVARDQFMARVVAVQGTRGVVLLAGNGHVRADIGVPRWLGTAVRARTESIGLLEDSVSREAGAFDRAVITPTQPREDPCAAMRRNG